MNATSATELRQQQIQQAEELLFSGPLRAGFAKGLYFGQFRAEAMFPWPVQPSDEQQTGDEAVAAVEQYVQQHLDPAAIDRNADIPPEVIRGLAELGVLGMTVAPEHGGRGFTQKNYCRVMEVIGGHCAATAVFVNAHHSIGLRALELFGTPEQKARWMRPLATGEQLAAFALTEPEAGSDASNVQTRATPTEDGTAYILNGEKRYITNGGIADVLTVMARTPDDRDPDGRVTAFLVTPDMPGFEVVEPRMEKCGIRGTATARLAFHNMRVPRENLLGERGRGLRLALTVLDFGRTTFGASCTGAAKFCVEHMARHAARRRQFGRALGEFELVQGKIAEAAADTFAMESATWYTAELIDSGSEDYMLETAMLKVFASDMLWRIVNDTLQIYGGAGYFSDQPFERMMRDARINLIGEGANDVLRCFIAMVGLRDLGKQMESMLKKPWQVVRLWRSRPQLPQPAMT
ncbi:MAG: acyl-CoA dehydrogenase family protein, partial [Planctomycetaceae bacterium]|nr:acyl-CoA dehydrogenase family protein [Planctomycetaceae bacterium]